MTARFYLRDSLYRQVDSLGRPFVEMNLLWAADIRTFCVNGFWYDDNFLPPQSIMYATIMKDKKDD